jgi:hypothetical protein
MVRGTSPVRCTGRTITGLTTTAGGRGAGTSSSRKEGTHGWDASPSFSSLT